jgi:hypothetical protein
MAFLLTTISLSCQKPKGAIYIKTSKELQASIVFSSGTSFLGYRILCSQRKPFVINNIYSHGGRNTALAELIKTFTPDESSILIGDFNCYHSWWCGNIKFTKNHMKTRELRANVEVIVDWLESQDYKLHNKPNISTHYLRGPTKNSPTVIDVCFSGEISNSVDAWVINHDPTPDHGIIAIRIIGPEIRSSNPTKAKYIRAWSKVNWTEFSSYICSNKFRFRKYQ